MAGRDGNKQLRSAKARRRGATLVGGAVGAFAAAAAMATGSAVNAPTAKADIDALLDPIIQPLMTSLTDAIAGLDPAAATDLTSWTDSLLAGLNSIDLAVPSAADPAAALAAASDSTSGPYDIPITMQEATEPTVQATVDGATNTLLVDTGSSGLVLPWQDLGSNDFSALENLFELGFPTGISESGYSGGVDYIYLTYDNATVDYGGVLTTTDTPIDVEILSWPTSFSANSPLDFQQFLADDDATGILGIGSAGTGPGDDPLESTIYETGYDGVTVDEPAGELIVGSNPYTTDDVTLSGDPITDVYVSVDGSTPVEVTGDIDSGGVYGTIPENALPSGSTETAGETLPAGTTITVYGGPDETDELYSYTTTATNSPTVVSSGSYMDTGYEPFLLDPIYLNYVDTTFDLSS